MVVAGFLIHRSGRHFFGQADSAVGHIVDRANQELIFWFALWGVWTIFVGPWVSILEDRGFRSHSKGRILVGARSSRPDHQAPKSQPSRQPSQRIERR
jgi:hypothetical protein